MIPRSPQPVLILAKVSTGNWWLEILIRVLELEMQFQIKLKLFTWKVDIHLMAFLWCVFQTQF